MKIFRLSSRMLLLFVVIIASFLAAFIGQIVVNNLSQGPSLVGDQGFIIRPSDDPFLKLQTIQEDVVQQQQSLVSIYEQVGNQLQLRSTGVILTSDGWIVALHTDDLDTSFTHIRLASGELYPIVSKHFAKATPVQYLFIDQSNLQPITVNEDYTPQILTPYPSVMTEGWGVSYYLGEDLSDNLYLSSDQQNRFAQFASAEEGSIILNQKAEMIGIMNGTNMVATNDLLSGLTSILKDEEVIMTSLGVYYIDLAHQALLDQFSASYTKGALVTNAFVQGEAFTSALLTSSAAYTGGLRLNDLIVRVDGEELTKSYTLSDAITQKRPGDAIELMVMRGSQELALDITLE